MADEHALLKALREERRARKLATRQIRMLKEEIARLKYEIEFLKEQDNE